MTIAAMILALASMLTTVCLIILIDRQQRTIDRIAEDLDDLWGVTDALDLDTRKDHTND